ASPRPLVNNDNCSTFGINASLGVPVPRASIVEAVFYSTSLERAFKPLGTYEGLRPWAVLGRVPSRARRACKTSWFLRAQDDTVDHRFEATSILSLSKDADK